MIGRREHEGAKGSAELVDDIRVVGFVHLICGQMFIPLPFETMHNELLSQKEEDIIYKVYQIFKQISKELKGGIFCTTISSLPDRSESLDSGRECLRQSFKLSEQSSPLPTT